MKSSCSWCNTLVDVRIETCPTCGHDAQRARMDCACPQCTNLLSKEKFLAMLEQGAALLHDFPKPE